MRGFRDVAAPGDQGQPGTTSLAHLHENLEAQSIVLTPAEMRAIDGIAASGDAGGIAAS